MQVLPTPLPGVLIFEPRVFSDERGYFFESYHEQRYSQAGLQRRFVQDNHSRSIQGTLRGLHYQLHHPQGKLVRVTLGEVFDVAVDIRQGSPTFGQWFGTYLSADNQRQMYIPEGFAHGFCVTSEVADFLYKCTDFYVASDDRGIFWNDPELKISWPISQPLLSLKDAARLPLSKMSADDLPRYQES